MTHGTCRHIQETSFNLRVAEGNDSKDALPGSMDDCAELLSDSPSRPSRFSRNAVTVELDCDDCSDRLSHIGVTRIDVG